MPRLTPAKWIFISAVLIGWLTLVIAIVLDHLSPAQKLGQFAADCIVAGAVIGLTVAFQ